MKISLVFLFFIPITIFSQTNFEKAEKLFNHEKFAAAKPIFESIYKENPNQLKTIEYLGDIASNAKDWDKAAFYYEKLKTLKPNGPDYHFKFGVALAMKAQTGGKWVAIGLISDIRGSFEKALSLNPNHIQARWALIEYYLQLPAIVGGSERKAQRYSNELFKISPVDGYLSKAHIDEYFKRFKSAEKNYIKAIEIGGSKNSYQKLAALYREKLNQPEKALQVLQEYKEKNKS